MQPANVPTSPFGSHSWEPRFVVEHYNRAVLRAGLEVWRLQRFMARPDEVVTIARLAQRTEYLVIARPGDAHPSVRDPWEDIDPPMSLDHLVARIDTWLRTVATYPPKPSFEGGEEPGFVMFGEYFLSSEAKRGNDGALIVLPKWFEIHK